LGLIPNSFRIRDAAGEMQRVLPGLRRVIHDEARAPARTYDDGRLPDTKPRLRIVIFVDVVGCIQRFAVDVTVRK